MKGAAVRSRLLEVKRQRDAANRGRTLLEQKREALLRELLSHTRVLDRHRARAAQALAEARSWLHAAQIETGRSAVEGAALAQGDTTEVESHAARLLGIALPALKLSAEPFRARYGFAGTTASVDSAGAAFFAALPGLVDLAGEELTVRALRKGLTRTVRRLNALEKIVLPRLEREIIDTSAALDEEERDEAFRRKRWLLDHSTRASETKP